MKTIQTIRALGFSAIMTTLLVAGAATAEEQKGMSGMEGQEGMSGMEGTEGNKKKQ